MGRPAIFQFSKHVKCQGPDIEWLLCLCVFFVHFAACLLISYLITVVLQQASE